MNPTYRLKLATAYVPDSRIEFMVPPIAERRALAVHSVARLFVDVDGKHEIYPWVLIVEVTPTGYVGEVGGFCNSSDWLPYGTRVVFTPEHIIDF